MHFQNCLHISTFSKRNRLHFYMKKCCFFFFFSFCNYWKLGEEILSFEMPGNHFFQRGFRSLSWLEKMLYLSSLSREYTLISLIKEKRMKDRLLSLPQNPSLHKLKESHKKGLDGLQELQISSIFATNMSVGMSRTLSHANSRVVLMLWNHTCELQT